MAKVKLDSFTNYLIFLFLMFSGFVTAFICGSNNHQNLIRWYTFCFPLLMVLRVVSFYIKNYLLYMLELCYFVNFVSIFAVYFNVGMKYIYPYLHGPLPGYSLMFGDAFVPHDLDKTTSFALHAFSTLVTKRLYWNGDQSKVLSLNDFEINTFITEVMISSLVIYVPWLILYTVGFLFPYKGTAPTMVRWNQGSKFPEDAEISNEQKIFYIIKHAIGINFMLIIGNFNRYCWQTDYIMVYSQIIMGFVHGGWHYFNGHGFKINEAKNIVTQSVKTHVSLTDKGIDLKIGEKDGTSKYISFGTGGSISVGTKSNGETETNLLPENINHNKND